MAFGGSIVVYALATSGVRLTTTVISAANSPAAAIAQPLTPSQATPTGTEALNLP
jgi:hypothetical protein